MLESQQQLFKKMNKISQSLTIKTGSYQVLSSTHPDVELQNENIWNFIYPKIKKHLGKTIYTNAATNESLTYNAYLDQSLCWAKEMNKQYLLHSKARALVLLPNCPEYFPVILGLFAIGMPVCPTKHDCTVYFLQSLLKIVKPQVIVADKESSLKAIEENLKLLNLDVNPKIYVRGTSEKYTSINEILKSGDQLDIKEAGKYSASDPMMICFSSGTTGSPKGIVFGNDRFVNFLTVETHPSVCNFSSDLKNGMQRTVLSNTPTGHSFGIIYSVILPSLFGYKLVDYNTSDGQNLYDAVKKYQPDLVIMQSFLLVPISKMENLDALNCVRSILITGSTPNDTAVRKLKQKTGIYFQNLYGLTEGMAVAKSALKSESLNLKIFPNVKLRLVDLETKKDIQDPNQLGEIFIMSPFLMLEYLDNTESTQAALSKDNWFQTGDVGFLDQEGCIKIVDRVKDKIHIAGKVVFPSKIEELVLQHPGVKEVGIIGIQGPSSTQELVLAFVVLKCPGEVTEESIVQFVEERAVEAPELKITGGVKFLEELPRNPMGKLLRKFLRRNIMYDQHA